MSKPDANTDLSALTEIDRLVHEPARMAVMSLLYVVESTDFIFLVNQTGLTWGNLSAHISKLEGAGYIEVNKAFKGKRPNTTSAADRKRQAGFPAVCIANEASFWGVRRIMRARQIPCRRGGFYLSDQVTMGLCPKRTPPRAGVGLLNRVINAVSITTGVCRGCDHRSR